MLYQLMTFTVVLGLFVVILPSITSAQVSNQNFVTFGKSIFGFSIKHPIDWAVQEFDRNVRDDRIGFDLIAIMCPKSIAKFPYKDSMPEYVQCPEKNDLSVATSRLPKNSTLDEYINYLETTNKFAYTDYNVENSSSTTLASFPARELLYTFIDEYQGQDEIIKVLEVIAYSGNRTYEVKYTSPQMQFDDLTPIVKKMINSIKILPMPPCNFVQNDTESFGGKCTLKSSLAETNQ